MESAPHLQIEQDGAVATLTLNRPDKLNALSAALIAELMQALSRLRGASRRAWSS